MKYPHTLLLFVAAFAFLGAGCRYDSPVSLDKYRSEAPPSEAPPVQPTGGLGVSPSPVPEREVPRPPVADASSTISTTTPDSRRPTRDARLATPEILAFPGILPASRTANKQVRIKTAKGDIVFELLPAEGPRAASNFVYLVKKKFYNGLTFHRVEPGFVIQGGDPKGSGFGDPGYRFDDDPVRLPYTAGIVAMANSGSNTNGSQFFIVLADTSLQPKYSIFGRVVKGMDVVKKIAIGDKMISVTIESKR